MTKPRIILASASPRRAQLLKKLVRRFDIVASHVAEIDDEHLSPREQALRHAFAKAREVAHRFPDAIVIGADTIVVLGRKIFNKPRDMAEAEWMLTQLQGRTHRVITGVCVLHLNARKKKWFAETTAVTFHKLTLDEIRHYLSRIHPFDKAGAYAAQEYGRTIIKNYNGSFNNVIGLPIEKLRLVLKSFG